MRGTSKDPPKHVPSPPTTPRRGPGVCAMRGSCGRTSMFGAELPCPDNGNATQATDDVLDLMRTVCGPAYELPSAVCCTKDQLETLGEKMQQAAPLIASCPACINNFRSFYCDFTCSPDQSTFLTVASTQKTTTDGKEAVKEVEYRVSDEFRNGFYDACKGVQFGATNGFAMDLIGGGAKNGSAFLKYMGDLRPGLGSPFQISFPEDGETSYARSPLNCSDSDLNSRCACVDCPDVCPSLPYIAPPSSEGCRVGAVSCLTFSMLIIYSVAILAGLVYYSYKQALRHRQRKYERLAMTDPPLSPTGMSGNGNGGNGLDGLVGRGDDAESGPSGSIHFRWGRGGSLLDPMEHLQPKQNRINAVLRRFFYRLGLWCASRPAETFAIAAVIIGILNIGWRNFQVETDPVRLWVAPNSETAQQKHFFDENFGPFYRSEQVFISLENGETPINYETLDWWLGVEREIANLKTEGGVSLQDVCFAPTGEACVVQSVSAWMGDIEDWGRDGWKDRFESCAERPGECLPDFGQPIEPRLVLGGANGHWSKAKAIVTTWVVSNYNDKRVKPAEAWERTLERYFASLHRDGVRISYSTGVSLEEELNAATNTDVKIVVLSYLVMFLYVSLTLGGGLPPSLLRSTVSQAWRTVRHIGALLKICNKPSQPVVKPSLSAIPTLLSVNSKFSLGLFGIVIVLIAVSTSVGLFSFLGVRVTLIIAEVIPFLVLAVGVDNVFILVHELDRQNSLHAQEAPPPAQHVDGGHADDDNDDDDDGDHQPGQLLAPEERVARAVARMGPSILLSSVTEVTAFALGALVGMPAVRNFAIYAAGSVFLGAVMQVTVFVAAMALDLKRAESMRIDCFPCVRLRPPIGLYDRTTPSEGVVNRFMRTVYAPFLLHREVKQLVLALFGGLFLVAVIGIQHISLGLDQRLALPSESFLVPYFNDLDTFFDFGPPVYFVVSNSDLPKRQGQQQLCGRFTTCQELSVANTLEAERKRPEVSYLASPPASWIDDFLQWTNPTFESCCRVRIRNETQFCNPRDSDRLCKPCFQGHDWDITMNGLPESTEFSRYLDQWLRSPTDESCPLGGQAPYSSAISFSKTHSVTASHFRTYHTPLKSQEDFIEALESAQRISRDISRRTGVKVFPYSLFYVFFDQYTHIVSTAIYVLAFALLAILTITSVLLGSWRTGATVTFTCFLAVTSVTGIMGFWGISLNAISLVNLVISLGIAVEFCSHIARAFMGASGPGILSNGSSGGGNGSAGGYGGLSSLDKEGAAREKDERAIAALIDVGPSVFSGITMTKLIGISVLALTRSKLLEVYYFRMWLALILSGALHGLVFLPVLLSYTGGAGYALEDTDEEWVTSQMRRPMDYEYQPFADTDSVVSDG